MEHLTKEKGDIGVACVIADLTKRGLDVAIPLSEHLPFDLIAISSARKMRRIQVKYRSIEGSVIRVKLANCASNSRGFYYKPIDRETIDAFAIYCPESEEIYYVPIGDVKAVKEFSLRIIPAKNNQRSGIRSASKYLDPARIF